MHAGSGFGIYPDGEKVQSQYEYGALGETFVNDGLLMLTRAYLHI